MKVICQADNRLAPFDQIGIPLLPNIGVCRMGFAKVLVVDDNPDILMTVEGFLADHSYVVTTASSAHEAIRIIRDGAVPDILVSDIVMPGPLDGIGLANIVKTEHPSVGVLLMTGWSYDDGHGFPVLNKPFQLKDITAWIDEFLDAA